MGPACSRLLLMRKAPEQLEGHSSSGFCLKRHMWVIVLHFLSWPENRIAVLFVFRRQKVLPLSCMKSQIFDIIYKREIPEKLHFGTSPKDYYFFSLSSTQLKGIWKSCTASLQTDQPASFPSTVVTGLTPSQGTFQYCRINIFQQKIIPLENLSGSSTIRLEMFRIHQYAEHIFIRYSHTIISRYFKWLSPKKEQSRICPLKCQSQLK